MASSDLRSRALRLLARREHTRQELQRKLLPHCAPEDDLDALLADLTAAGWLSDERAAAAVVHARQQRQGVLKLQQELSSRGVPAAVAEPLLTAARENELAVARALWRRKFGALPATAEERARQGRYLQNRGFSLAVIRQVLRGEA